jgi:hypothetical protein
MTIEDRVAALEKARRDDKRKEAALALLKEMPRFQPYWMAAGRDVPPDTIGYIYGCRIVLDE